MIKAITLWKDFEKYFVANSQLENECSVELSE